MVPGGWHARAGGCLRTGSVAWSDAPVTAGSSPQRRTFCVCLFATDQLSVDDRMCRPALPRP